MKLKEVTEDIEKYENLSDDEYYIYENNAVTNAYASAKMKVQQKALREKKWRSGEKRF